MNLKLFLIILSINSLILISNVPECSAIQAVSPADGDTLTTTQVLFQWDPAESADLYELEISLAGNGELSSDSMITSISTDDPQCLLCYIFNFGRSYKWRYRSRDYQGNFTPWSPIISFHIEQLPLIQNIETKTHDLLSYQPGITLFDCGEYDLILAVDQKGKIVLFNRAVYPSYVKLLPNGHLLYIQDRAVEQRYVYEVSLNGREVYFRSEEGYHHHGASPMPDGGYLAMQADMRTLPLDGSFLPWQGDRIKHYNKEGEVIWDWNAFDYISIEDVDSNHVVLAGATGWFDWLHTNACIYDDKENAVIISVRNLSRIIKIDYASKGIVWSMGLGMPSGAAEFGGGLFSFQHAPELLPNGNLLLFDNGGCPLTADPSHSRAIEISFDFSRPAPAVIAWEYDLGFFYPTRGAVSRLPNGNTLITASVAGSYADIIEVNQLKETMWQMTTDFGVYGAYRVASLYQQVFQHDFTKPSFRQTAPASSGIIDTCAVSYTLSETLLYGQVTLTGTGGVPDPDSPHMRILEGKELNAGIHTIIALTDSSQLVDGGIYSISFDGYDFAGNEAATVVETDVLYDSPGVAQPQDLHAVAGASQVSLGWSANRDRDLSHYFISRNTESLFNEADSIMIVPQPDTSCIDSGLVNGTIYWYWATAVDISGNKSMPSEPVSATPTVQAGLSGFYDPSIPGELYLSQNIPNPFNLETNIRFALPEDTFVTLQIMNITGQLIRTLKHEWMEQGYHHVLWDGKDALGREASSGIYFYWIETGGFSQSKRMVLLK